MFFQFKKYILVLILFSVSTYSIDAVTFDAFLSDAIQNHPFFQSESIRVDIAKTRVSKTEAITDPSVAITPHFTHQKPVMETSFQPLQLDSTGVQLNIQKPVLETGGTLTAGLDVKKVYQGYDVPSEFDSFVQNGSFFTNTVSVGYTHPLKKNKNGALTQLPIQLSKLQLDATKEDSKENQEDMLLLLGNQFLDWAFLSEQAQILQNRLKIAKKSLVLIQKKYDAHLVEKVDVLRSKEAVRTVEQNLLIILSQKKAFQSRIAVTLNSSNYIHENPVFNLYQRHSVELESPTVSRRLIAFEDQKKAIELELNALDHSRKPDLDLISSISLSDGSEELGDSLAFGNPTLSLAMSYKKPIRNDAITAEIQEKKLQLDALTLAITQTERELVGELLNLRIQLEDMETILNVSARRVASAKEMTEEEQRLYTQGRNPLTAVIQARDNVLAAEFTYAQNALAYQKLWLQYLALTDALLPKKATL